MIEKCPDPDFSSKTIQKTRRPDVKDLIGKIQHDYSYWDKVKYMALPPDLSAEELWTLVKFTRIQGYQKITIGNYNFSYYPTVFLQQLMHEFDLKFGGQITSNAKLTDEDKQKYLISSLMEEAISSSQIEGAVTTRRVAKEMLLQKRAPRNKSELMIMNNYDTIQFIRDIAHEPLNEKNLLKLHKILTSKTLDDRNDEGRFRVDNEVNVVDHVNGEVVHLPPDVESLPLLMGDLYEFFNNDNTEQFIHPVIRASIVHFLIGFIHPFVDGNGRTARALFYWYMLKKGYWLTEYLSISSVIIKTRGQYSRAFLYTETDNLDLTYFLQYKTRTIKLAYESLQAYLKRKAEEKLAISRFINLGGINERQAQILQWLDDEPQKVITVKEIETYFSIANQTARTDLQSLVEQGFMESRNINKKKQVFIKKPTTAKTS